jgi:hypothetical protein
MAGAKTQPWPELSLAFHNHLFSVRGHRTSEVLYFEDEQLSLGEQVFGTGPSVPEFYEIFSV